MKWKIITINISGTYFDDFLRHLGGLHTFPPTMRNEAHYQHCWIYITVVCKRSQKTNCLSKILTADDHDTHDEENCCNGQSSMAQGLIILTYKIQIKHSTIDATTTKLSRGNSYHRWNLCPTLDLEVEKYWINFDCWTQEASTGRKRMEDHQGTTVRDGMIDLLAPLTSCWWCIKTLSMLSQHSTSAQYLISSCIRYNQALICWQERKWGAPFYDSAMGFVWKPGNCDTVGLPWDNNKTAMPVAFR